MSRQCKFFPDIYDHLYFIFSICHSLERSKCSLMQNNIFLILCWLCITFIFKINIYNAREKNVKTVQRLKTSV